MAPKTPKTPTKRPNTRNNGESKQSYQENDVNELQTDGGDGKAAVGASGGGRKAKPRASGRITKAKVVRPKKPSTSTEEPEYRTASVKAFEKLRNALQNCQNTWLKATGEVEQQRDEAISEKVAIEAENKRCLQVKDDKIRNLTHAGLRIKRELGLSIESDDDIRTQLRQLWSRAKNWAKLYGVGGTAQTLAINDREGVLNILTSSGHASTSKHAFDRFIDQGGHKTTLLNAVFGKLILDQLLDSRFFFLKGVLGKRNNESLEEALMDVYDLGSEVNPNQSKVWMSQTMMMLNPSKSSITEYHVQSESSLHNPKQQCYIQFTETFLSLKALGPLLKSSAVAEDQKIYQDALQIFRDFGNYLLKLGTQKVRMEILSYKGLEHIPFSISDDRDLDNQPILLVVEPGIQAYGNEEGRNYNESKMWSPAVVIVASKKDAAEMALPPSVDIESSGNKSHSKIVSVKVDRQILSSSQGSKRKLSAREEEEEDQSSTIKRSCGGDIPPLDGSTTDNALVNQDNDERSADEQISSMAMTDMDDIKPSKAQEAPMSTFATEVQQAAVESEEAGAPNHGGVVTGPCLESSTSEQSTSATGKAGDAENPVELDD